MFIPVGVGVGTGGEPTYERVNDPALEAARRNDPNRQNPDLWPRVNYDPTGNVTRTDKTPNNNNNTPGAGTVTDNPEKKKTPQTPITSPQTPPLFTPIPNINPNPGQNEPPVQRTPEPPKVEQTPPGNSCCVATPIAQSLDRLEKKINPTDLIDWSILGVINSKLGPQVNGGISGYMIDRFTRLWNSRIIDRTLNLMTFAASVHNAAMLSRNLGSTLGAVFANVMTLFGAKDAEATAQQINDAIGSAFENAIKAVVGEQVYNNLSDTWKKASAIYNSALRIVQILGDSLFTLTEGMEIVGRYTGKIGNALKRSGQVLEDSYDWFSEQFNFQSRRAGAIERVVRGLEVANNVASDLEQVTANAREIQENINEMGQEWNTLKTTVEGDENAKKTQEIQKKANSQTPAINKTDMIKPGG
jgi:hypothetical protein